MGSVSVQYSIINTDSEVIDESHFGTNSLFHLDRVSDGSDFQKVVSQLSIQVLRYPGGTITEEYFNLSNPNANTQNNVLDLISGRDSVRQREVEPLDAFLDFCVESDIRPIVVLPTYRYFGQETRHIKPEAEIEIREFVASILRGDYGDVDIHSFEIGNEWYQDNFNWTAQEYAELQATMAGWVSDEISKFESSQDIGVYVQAGQTVEQNEILSAAFSSENAGTIDGVVTHLYGTNSSGNPLRIGSGAELRLEMISEVWQRRELGGLDLVVTEWNVGESGESTTKINGIMRSAPLLRMFVEMIENGVDVATIWTAQAPGPAGLSNREGEGSELTPTGYLLGMLGSSLVGSHLLTLEGGNRLVDEGNTHVGYTYAFESPSETTVYFVSGVPEEIDISADFSEFVGSDVYIYASILGAAPDDTGTTYRSEASISFLTGLEAKQSNDGSFVFDFEIDAYEMYEFHFVDGVGVSISGDPQNNIDDLLIGTEYADQLEGQGGDDQLYGSAGEDTLLGGQGHDLLEGGNDHDSIIGGSGNDTLLGEHGKDWLFGDVGDDLLDGGHWHDTLFGGEGNDVLNGGNGNDYLLPGDGNNTIDGGEGYDVLSYESVNHGVFIFGSTAQIETKNGLSSITGIEEITGSSHSDLFQWFTSDSNTLNDVQRISGGGGDDSILLSCEGQIYVSGGEGNDFVQVYTGSAEVSGGNGNDTIWANAGQIAAFGGAGSDKIVGGVLDDIIDGGSGDDTLYGGLGSDVFVFSDLSGRDRIMDFDVGRDLLDFGAMNLDEARLVPADNGTALHVSPGVVIEFVGVEIAEVEALF